MNNEVTKTQLTLPQGSLGLELEPEYWSNDGSSYGIKVRTSIGCSDFVTRGTIINSIDGSEISKTKFNHAVNMLKTSNSRLIDVSHVSKVMMQDTNGGSVTGEITPKHSDSKTPSQKNGERKKDGLLMLLNGQVNQKKSLLINAQEQTEILSVSLEIRDKEIESLKRELRRLRSEHSSTSSFYADSNIPNQQQEAFLIHWHKSASFMYDITTSQPSQRKEKELNREKSKIRQLLYEDNSILRSHSKPDRKTATASAAKAPNANFASFPKTSTGSGFSHNSNAPSERAAFCRDEIPLRNPSAQSPLSSQSTAELMEQLIDFSSSNLTDCDKGSRDRKGDICSSITFGDPTTTTQKANDGYAHGNSVSDKGGISALPLSLPSPPSSPPPQQPPSLSSPTSKWSPHCPSPLRSPSCTLTTRSSGLPASHISTASEIKALFDVATCSLPRAVADGGDGYRSFDQIVEVEEGKNKQNVVVSQSKVPVGSCATPRNDSEAGLPFPVSFMKKLNIHHTATTASTSPLLSCFLPTKQLSPTNPLPGYTGYAGHAGYKARVDPLRPSSAVCASSPPSVPSSSAGLQSESIRCIAEGAGGGNVAPLEASFEEELRRLQYENERIRSGISIYGQMSDIILERMAPEVHEPSSPSLVWSRVQPRPLGRHCTVGSVPVSLPSPARLGYNLDREWSAEIDNTPTENLCTRYTNSHALGNNSISNSRNLDLHQQVEDGSSSKVHSNCGNTEDRNSNSIKISQFL